MAGLDRFVQMGLDLKGGYMPPAAGQFAPTMAPPRVPVPSVGVGPAPQQLDMFDELLKQPRTPPRAPTPGPAVGIKPGVSAPMPAPAPPAKAPSKLMAGMKGLGRAAVSPWNAVIAGVLPYDMGTGDLSSVEFARQQDTGGVPLYDPNANFDGPNNQPLSPEELAKFKKEFADGTFVSPAEYPELAAKEGPQHEGAYFGDDDLSGIGDKGLKRRIALDRLDKNLLADPAAMAELQALGPQELARQLQANKDLSESRNQSGRQEMSRLYSRLARTDPSYNRLANEARTDYMIGTGVPQEMADIKAGGPGKRALSRTKAEAAAVTRAQTEMKAQEAGVTRARDNFMDYFKRNGSANPEAETNDLVNKWAPVFKRMRGTQDFTRLETLMTMQDSLAQAAADSRGGVWEWLFGADPEKMESPREFAKVVVPLSRGVALYQNGDKDATVDINGSIVDVEDIMDDLMEQKVPLGKMMHAMGWSERNNGDWKLSDNYGTDPNTGMKLDLAAMINGAYTD